MATINYISIPSKRLSASITGSSVSFQLNNITGWDGSNLTSSDLGSKAYGVFRNDDNTLMEIFEYDPTTIASASISFIRRGLKFTGDLTTEVSANKLTWVKNETIVELGTDVPQLLNHIVRVIGDQTIDGIKTFTSVPITTGGDPINDNDLARKAWVTSLALGTSNINRVVVAGTAGVTIAAGNLIYFDDTSNNWKLTDADTASIVDNVLLGIAQGAGTAANPISGGVLLFGLDSNQSGMTIGDPMYASNTAGAITSSSAQTTVVEIGIALAATQLYFIPRYQSSLTKKQRDALAGNNGTPSSTNKFLTQSGFQNASEVYAASSAGTDTYAITLSPAPAAYANGQVYRFKADVANTGAATLNVNGLGAITINKLNDQALSDNDIEANQIVEVVYNSTGPKFQMQSHIANTFSRRLHTFTTDVVIASSVAETTLMTFTVPGGTLSTANVVKGIINLSALRNDSTTCTLRLKYGGTTMATITINVGTFPSVEGELTFDVLGAGATNSQEGVFRISADTSASFDITGGDFAMMRDRVFGTAAVDSTADQTLLVTAQFGTSSAADTLTAANGYAEAIIG